jgi:hypothetical protein
VPKRANKKSKLSEKYSEDEIQTLFRQEIDELAFFADIYCKDKNARDKMLEEYFLAKWEGKHLK